MVHDALREMEEKDITPDQSWMDELKGASATAFLGTLARDLRDFFTDPCYWTC